MKQITRVTVWSNVFFLVPFIYSIQNLIYWYSLLIGLMISVSVVYHWSKEKRFKYQDYSLSTLLIASNFILLISGNWVQPFSTMALSFALVAILFYRRQYNKNSFDVNHGLWHFFSAFTCYCSFLTFI
jgi:hypothetical protein